MTGSCTSIFTLAPGDIRQHIRALLEIGTDIAGEYWQLEHFLAELPEKWQLSLAAWSSGRPIGYAIVSKKEPTCAHLHHFAVAPSVRGRGIGRELLARAEANAGERGCVRMTLKVATESAGAIRFYERNGFRTEDAEHGYLTMAKVLRAKGLVLG